MLRENGWQLVLDDSGTQKIGIRYRPDGPVYPLKHSAVVIPLVLDEESGELCVLLTSRSRNIKFKGVAAFPGGKVEEGETELQAALREMEEEIGLSAEHLSSDLIALDYQYTSHGFEIRPYIGVVSYQALRELTLSTEVGDAFLVPLQSFADAKHLKVTRSNQGLYGVEPLEFSTYQFVPDPASVRLLHYREADSVYSHDEAVAFVPDIWGTTAIMATLAHRYLQPMLQSGPIASEEALRIAFTRVTHDIAILQQALDGLRIEHKDIHP